MTTTEKMYKVTRWCCKEGYCVDCHNRRGLGLSAGSKVWLSYRKRVVQGDNLTMEQAKKFESGWTEYEPKIEELS